MSGTGPDRPPRDQPSDRIYLADNMDYDRHPTDCQSSQSRIEIREIGVILDEMQERIDKLEERFRNHSHLNAEEEWRRP